MCLAACGGTRDGEESGETADALSEAATPRKGSTIQSPSVSPAKDYWGARSIEMLVKVGYLKPDEAQLAKRADGIIANSPPNGALGVDELAALESPAHVHTLFPAERAMLPKLWAILEIGPAAPAQSTAPSVQFNVVDAYTPQAVQHPIASLSGGLQTLARRIQLSANSDGDDQTISGADVAEAYADRGSYLPGEIQSLGPILQEISAASPRLPAETQRIEVSTAPSTKSVLFDKAGAKGEMTATLSIAGTYGLGTNPAAGGQLPQLRMVVSNTLSLATTGATVIILNKSTGVAELGRNGGPLYTGAADTRVEVWTGGARIAEFDVAPAPPPTMTPFPFGYAVKLGNVMHVLKCSPQGCTYSPQGGVAASTGVTPTGSYLVTNATGKRIDVFEGGRGIITESGTTRPCYPSRVDASLVTQCMAFSAGRFTVYAFTRDADNPALGKGVSTGEFLYPF